MKNSRLAILVFSLTASTLVSCQKYELSHPLVKGAATLENADSASKTNPNSDDNSAANGPVVQSPAASISAPCVFPKAEATLVY